MKRIISVFAVALLLVAAFASFAVSAEESTFHVTHYNDSGAEGACVVFTEAYSGGGWWIHVAFAPVEGKENTYEIVETVNGTGDGSAAPLEVPEGGFVYGLNTGNNWGDLTQAAIDAGNFESQWWYGNYQQDQEYYTTNFVNEATRAMIATATTWMVGDIFVINGLDLEGLTVPTSTPDTKWYDEGYVCTATYSAATDDSQLPAESDPEAESTPADESKPADESVPADTSAPANNSADNSADAPAEGGNTTLWIVLGVVGAVVVVAVIVIVSKKKK